MTVTVAIITVSTESTLPPLSPRVKDPHHGEPNQEYSEVSHFTSPDCLEDRDR